MLYCKHVLQVTKLLEIFNKNEVETILQNVILCILDNPESEPTNTMESLQCIRESLKSLNIRKSSNNKSTLDLQVKNKTDAITIPKELSTFSLYTHVGELHFDNEHDLTKLSIMHININSLPKRFTTFRITLTRFKRLPDIIAVTETQFLCGESNQLLKTKYKIPHFKLHIPKSKRSDDTGGVAMYVNENFEVKPSKNETLWEKNVYESLYLDIQAGATSFVCGVIYTKKDSDPTIFRSKLTSCLENITRENKTALICGDLNLDLLGKAPHVFKKVMLKHNFAPLIIRPTRYCNRESTKGSRTLIDHIWFNKPDLFLNSAILVDYFGSDHLAVCCFFKISKPRAKTKKKSKDDEVFRTLQVKGKDKEKNLKNQAKLTDKHLDYLVNLTNDYKGKKVEFPSYPNDIEKAKLIFF